MTLITANLILVLELLRKHLSSNRVDLFFVMAGTGAAWMFPRLFAGAGNRFERLGNGLARKRRLTVLAVGILALAMRAALLPIRPIPQPRYHDEFSYLLAADTFAHGHLTNPTHPMWIHFETFQVLSTPTYMSKYYPAQGLVLAAGQVVAGNPFWGIWFSLGVMCAAICWMLQGWMPPGWALLGGLLCVLCAVTYSFWGSNELAAFSLWGDSYWGGTVAATGGALVLGALPRLRRSPRVHHALLLGLGLAILANSRPYEGLLLGLAALGAIAVWLRGKKGPPFGVILRRIAAPLFLMLVPAIAAMGYYFWRVTGNPCRVPYVAYQSIYDPVPLFFWQPLRPSPDYHHPEMKKLFLGWELNQYRFARNHPGELILKRATNLATFFFGPLLLIPVAALILVQRGRFFRGLTRPCNALLLLVCSLPLAGMALSTYFAPHYAAPLTGGFYALIMLSMRHLRLWRWRGQPVGRQMVRAAPVLAVVILVVHTSVLAGERRLSTLHQDFGRGQILAQLRNYPDGQLVVVQYAPNHNPHNEWVYNDADIDAAKVVWARDMGRAANEELIRYFSHRRAWLLEADDSPSKLLPYASREDSKGPSGRQ